MNQFEEFKKFLDSMNIQYKVQDADYFKHGLNGLNPSGHETYCEEGYVQIDLTEYMISPGFCSLTFAKDDGRFIGVEAE